MVDAVDRRDIRAGNWKNKFLEKYALNSITRGYFCNSCFAHIVETTGKQVNKRLYIGPGRDGSSDDKLAVNCKYMPHNTEVPRNKVWETLGYRKTTYGEYEDQGWVLMENQRRLDHKIEFSVTDRPSRLVILLHPYASKPKGIADDDEVESHAYNCSIDILNPDEDAAYFFDMTQSAFFNEGKKNRFPDPVTDKSTTFDKKQKKK